MITIDIDALATAIAERLDIRPWMSVDEAAEYLRVSRSTVEKLIARKEIPFSRIGSRVLLNRHELDAWLATNQEG